jgi:hypothetical protein
MPRSVRSSGTTARGTTASPDRPHQRVPDSEPARTCAAHPTPDGRADTPPAHTPRPAPARPGDRSSPSGAASRPSARGSDPPRSPRGSVPSKHRATHSLSVDASVTMRARGADPPPPPPSAGLRPHPTLDQFALLGQDANLASLLVRVDATWSMAGPPSFAPLSACLGGA